MFGRRKTPPEYMLLEDQGLQEIVIHRSSQPRGSVGWIVRLRRLPKESDKDYLKRSLDMNSELEKGLITARDLTKGLEESIDKERR